MPAVRHEHPYLLHDAILQQPDAQEIVAMLNEALAKGVSVGEAVS